MKQLFIIVLFLICGTVSSQKPADVNGWEFLEWKSDSATVAQALKKHKKELKEGHALDADFNFNGMNTWLQYDSTKLLARVQQRADFNVNQQKQAEAAYEKHRDYMVKKYGNPSKEKIDRKQSTIQFWWDFPATKIYFEYDFNYKIIDEFGAGSYWVKILFEKKNNP